MCHDRAVPTTPRPAASARLEGLSSWVGSHPKVSLLGVAALLGAVQLAFRAWAALLGWFYIDDYLLIHDARAAGLSLAALFQPYDAQVMPVGRFLAWLVSLPDPLSWPVLVATNLAMQLLATTACVAMLITLFGWRWRVLVPLGFFLSSALTMPAFMWWAAALNQVPLQAVFFAAVATWVHYLRTLRLRWLGLTLLLLALGLLCYVKTLLVFPVLVFLALGWFASGGPVRRVVTVVRRYWPAVVAGVLGGAGYLAYYVHAAPRISGSTDAADAGELAGRMLGDSFGPALFGGPWRWSEQIAPVAQADAPSWTVSLSWVLAALVVAYLALRRERTLRAWVLLVGYVGADYILLLTTRAQAVGAVSGTEYRYLTDAACAVVLALSLASMELRGAEESSRPRALPVLTRGIGRRGIAVATAALVLSGAWSSWSYARVWHTNHPGAAFFRTAVASTTGHDHVDLASQYLPLQVTGSFDSRANSTSVVLPLLDPAVRFPTSTDDLHVLAEDGSVVPARVDPTTTSRPGPVRRCGWAVRDTAVSILLETPAIDVPWWLGIDYLASEDSGLRVRAGSTVRKVDVGRGIGTVYVQTRGSFSAVTLDGVDPGVTICVDRIAIGRPVPQNPLIAEAGR
jgi:hypothetical protein